jgi:hypothetical protein
MFRRVFAIVLCLAAIILVVGCGQSRNEPSIKGDYRLWSFKLKRTTPGAPAGPQSEADWYHGHFEFAFAEGDRDMDRHDICEVLHLDTNGKCEYRYPDEPIPGRFVRKRTFFQLSENEVRSLSKVVSEARFFQLADEYDANVPDGPRVFIKCKIGRWTKTVICLAHFPDQIVRIHDYVKRNIIERHAQDLHGEETGRKDSGRADFF